MGEIRKKPINWIRLTSAAFTAVLVGYASTVLVIMQAAKAAHATETESISWIAALCFGMAASSCYLSWRHKMPVITAWSTPGAVIVVTSAQAGQFTYAQALGAFIAAGFCIAITALVKPLARAVTHIPPSIASAMLGGVLLQYALEVPQAAKDLPGTILPLIIIYFILRQFWPLYAVPLLVVFGLVIVLARGQVDASCCHITMARLQWVMPEFNFHVILSLGVPLYLVTMASQNLPGFAVMKMSGYEPPVKDALLVTGLTTVALAPFGAHSVNMAAITASIVNGPETDPDPARRWLVSIPYLVIYSVVGLASGLFIEVLGAMPASVIVAIAGLALLTPLMNAITGMVKEPRDIECALVTFLVAASGVSFLGIGAPFWGLFTGLVLFAVRYKLIATK